MALGGGRCSEVPDSATSVTLLCWHFQGGLGRQRRERKAGHPASLGLPMGPRYGSATGRRVGPRELVGQRHRSRFSRKEGEAAAEVVGK